MSDHTHLALGNLWLVFGNSATDLVLIMYATKSKFGSRDLLGPGKTAIRAMLWDETVRAHVLGGQLDVPKSPRYVSAQVYKDIMLGLMDELVIRVQDVVEQRKIGHDQGDPSIRSNHFVLV